MSDQAIFWTTAAVLAWGLFVVFAAALCAANKVPPEPETCDWCCGPLGGQYAESTDGNRACMDCCRTFGLGDR